MRTLLSTLILLTLAAAAAAQQVDGVVFEDRDADGVLDPDEPLLEGIDVRLWGQQSGIGGYDQTRISGADGSYSFLPGDGCYLIRPQAPAGWRLTHPRADRFPEGSPGYSFPVGEPRFGTLDQGIANLLSGSYLYSSIGDSIAWNWNSCFYQSTFWYSRQVRDRMACAAPGTTITLDEDAVKGEHTDDLLVDESNDDNNVFRLIDKQPDLVTISMIGNDLLDVDAGNNPTQEETNRAVAEVLDARQNLQEVISSLLSEVPGVDIALNTLYDNEADRCAGGTDTSSFHRDWVPIVNRMLRELAWGQIRPVTTNEVASEFGYQDLNLNCSGFQQKICRDLFQTDLIHPNNDGYVIVREKVWEGIGGTTLGSGDALGRSSLADVDYGLLRRVRRLLPTTFESRNGATASSPETALSDADGGAAAAITLGIVNEEFRVGGFPDWFDEIQIVKVVAGVRYRTNGTAVDDFYRIEAAPTGQFRPPPGFDYSPTAWNFYTPLVGAGGPSQPAENPDYANAELLVRPNVASYREVSATLTKDPVLPPGADEYEWPPLTHEELATTAVRVVSAPVAGTGANDAYQVELDYAWLDLYGFEKPRPPEAANLEIEKRGDGSLAVIFDPVVGAQRYNVYFGRVASLPTGYDHGAGSAPAAPLCDAPTGSAPGGRLEILVDPADQPADDGYILVTGHADDVESPSGFSSAGIEIERSQSSCR